MRVSHAARVSLEGLGVGYVASLIAAFWLRAASSEAELVWNLVSPLKLGAWILTSAHAVPFVVRSGAGLTAPEAPGSIGRLSELLGGGQEVGFSFALTLIPISILAITGITVALLVRWSSPTSAREVLRTAGLVAAVHGVTLALIAWLAQVELVFEGAIAPDLGLGAATGRVGIALGHSPVVALVIGAMLGAAFATAGGISALPMRTTIAPHARVMLLGWMRGLAMVSALVAAALAVGALSALVTGRAPSFGMFALGGYLLWANAVAAGIVGVHGVSMAIALDAGPFTGWERMDLLHFGVSGSGAPKVLLLGVVVPVVAGVIAGRFCRRRSALSPPAIAIRFGALWGLTLAVLAMLLRVRILSSFSVGALDLGGGSAAFDPLVALALGAVWGTVTACAGALTTTPRIWACRRCGMPNAEQDRFCVSCGTTRATEARAEL